MTGTLLILEDDALLREQLDTQLTRHGWRCLTAENPEAAWAVLEGVPQLDAALLDQNLDGPSGLDLIEPLLARWPDCRVVMLTGYGSIPAAVCATRRGATDYLTKPVVLGDLLNVLEGRGQAREVPLHEAPPSLERLEWEHIQRVLLNHDGNVSAAARTLGMHRRTLQRRLRKRPSPGTFERDRENSDEQ